MDSEKPVDDSPNGIPLLGLGTWKNTEPTVCAESVRTALEMGYRHIDTAQIYKNEKPSAPESPPQTSTARRCSSQPKSGSTASATMR